MYLTYTRMKESIKKIQKSSKNNELIKRDKRRGNLLYFASSGLLLCYIIQKMKRIRLFDLIVVQMSKVKYDSINIVIVRDASVTYIYIYI